MLVKVWFTLQIAVRTVAYTIWAIELEVETLFIRGPKGSFWKRLKLFPAKLGFRTVILVGGGYHAVKLKLAASQCKKSQDKTLLDIISQNVQTDFGRDFQFDKIQSYQDFVRQLPIATYEDHQPYIERQMNGQANALVPGKPAYYASTSGTTGQPKYIPVTPCAAKRSHKDISLIWLYYLARRSIGFLNDYILAITGEAEEDKAPDGTFIGSTSGNLRKGLPGFMREIYAVPEEVFTIPHYDARYYCLALFSLRVHISYIATANPSTLTILFGTIEKHKEALITDIEKGTLNSDIELSQLTRMSLSTRLSPNPERAQELRNTLLVAGRMDPAFFWPRLSSIGCWKGGNSLLFLERLRKLLPDVVPIYDLGYLASEIRATVPVERSHHGGLPTLHRNFFEFIRVADWTRGHKVPLRLHELRLGERYYIIITTDSGLYRYHINDIVRVISFFGDTPELVFEQKGDGVTNLTGEKLYETQVQMAFSNVAAAERLPFRFFMCLLNAAEQRYEFLLEPELGQPDATVLQALDKELCHLNSEYRAKRDSQRLAHPVLHVLRKGAFETFRQKKVASGIREAQFKMVLLSSDIELLQEFPILKSYQGGTCEHT